MRNASPYRVSVSKYRIGRGKILATQRIAVSCAAGSRDEGTSAGWLDVPANCEAAPDRSGHDAGSPERRRRNAGDRGSVIGDRSLWVTCAQVRDAPAASGCTAMFGGIFSSF
jgi:hypothetical protein